MRLLLDTHTFLWWVSGSSALSRRARSLIANGKNECLVSLATCWEIAIKVSFGKLRIDAPVGRFLAEQLAVNGFQALPIDLRHVARLAQIPFHHRDPFDRLLAAQALEEGVAFVSADGIFGRYDIKRVW